MACASLGALYAALDLRTHRLALEIALPSVVTASASQAVARPLRPVPMTAHLSVVMASASEYSEGPVRAFDTLPLAHQ